MILVEPVEQSGTSGNILGRVAVVGLRLGCQPIVDVTKIDGEGFVLLLPETEERLAMARGRESASVMLLFKRLRLVYAFHYIYARQDEEARYLDIAHVEGMITVGPIYLLKHDARDELQLLGATLVPGTGKL